MIGTLGSPKAIRDSRQHIPACTASTTRIAKLRGVLILDRKNIANCMISVADIWPSHRELSRAELLIRIYLFRSGWALIVLNLGALQNSYLELHMAKTRHASKEAFWLSCHAEATLQLHCISPTGV